MRRKPVPSEGESVSWPKALPRAGGSAMRKIESCSGSPAGVLRSAARIRVPANAFYWTAVHIAMNWGN